MPKKKISTVDRRLNNIKADEMAKVIKAYQYNKATPYQERLYRRAKKKGLIG